jgi:hypothetical protein
LGQFSTPSIAFIEQELSLVGAVVADRFVGSDAFVEYVAMATAPARDRARSADNPRRLGRLNMIVGSSQRQLSCNLQE